MQNITEYHRAAITLHKAGFCVVPPKADGTKAPIGTWKNYMSDRSTPEEIDDWYWDGREGVGVVCGSVSNNLTMWEFEDENLYELFADNAEGTGLGSVLDSIAEGWSERTPGGGIHLYYRCEDVRGSKKLARKRHDNGDVEVLIETRGEGGFTVVSPSGGKTHETGNPYELLSGGPKTIATITSQDQHDLWKLCSVFDEYEVRTADEPTYVGSLRPGDDYNERADWRAILEPHGWRFLFERSGVWYLRRPGKDRGVSATINWNGLGLLRNFSSSTAFEERAYTKFTAYAILEHRGDFRSAAKTLASEGYGSRDRVPEADGVETRPIWREPDTLDRPGFPTFPVHRLPQNIRGFCRAVAEAIQVPPDYVAQTMLSSLSAAARGRYAVAVDGTAHREVLVLQTVLFAESGTRKSASFDVVKKPLSRYERDMRIDDEREVSAWETRMEMLEKDLKDAKRGKNPAEYVILDMTRQMDELKAERPHMTRVIADDVTPERLGTLIAEQGGPIAVMAPEGGFFGNISGRYSQGIPNMEYVLRGHAGEALIIDRMGREAYVPGAYVTIGISLQPSIVDELAQVPGFKGKGMAARLLPSFPHSLVGKRDVRATKPIDRDEVAQWESTILTILRQAEECLPDQYGEYDQFVLRLGRDAVELYYQYSEHAERQLAKGGGLSSIRDWGGKMVGHALRIAGLFHLVEFGDEAISYPISRGTLSDAIAVMEYFVPHARYLLERIDGTSYGEHLDELLRILRDSEEPIYRASLNAKLRSNRIFKGNGESITDALDELELLGYCRTVPEGGRKTRIEMNPVVGGPIAYASFSPMDVPSVDWTIELEDEDVGW